MEAFCKVCGELDAIVKKFETPAINSDLNSKRLARVQKNLKVLAKPAYRETEVLLFSGRMAPAISYRQRIDDSRLLDR
jgi:hypothetical protein